MRSPDLVAVVGVEQQAYQYPWTRRIFEDCLRVGYGCLVAESQQRISGHGIVAAAAGEAHILNICVGPGARRRGIGYCLLEALLEIAHRAGAKTAYLEVRRSNEGAIALYEGTSFERVGCRRDYYPAPFGREDALVMSRRIVAPP